VFLCNSIRLKLPRLPKILTIHFKLSSILSLMWLPICWVRTRQIYPKVFVFICSYADDVALMAESESDLQTMLNIASSFATTWKLNFNSNKSKVLVVWKYIDQSNKWVLGGTYIEETNAYRWDLSS
jgi:hypothetical protein